MNEKKKTILIAIAALAVLAGVTVLFGEPLVRLASQPQELRDAVERLGPAAPLAMAGMMFLQVVVAFIPGEVFEIGAGYVFGAWYGLFLCLAGTVAGSALIFLLVKKWGIPMASRFLPMEKLQSLSFIQDSRRRNLLVFLLFLLPGTPKDVLTYFIGLTPMRLSTFVLLTTVARIPSILTSTMGGDALGLQSYGSAVLIFAFTGAVSLAGLLCYRRIQSSAGKKKSNQVEKGREKNASAALSQSSLR